MRWFGYLVGLMAIYATLAAATAGFQRNLLYHPDPTRVAPSTLGLANVREIILERPDGVRLIAWYGKAAPGRPTLLYFHGNAGNLANRSERMRAYLGKGVGIFMLSYRGYGGSTGQPTESDNVADALAAYDALAESGVAGADIVLYGESLGTGVAVQVALKRAVGGIVLDAPYTSIPDVGQRHYWYLPVQLLAIDRYETLDQIGRVTAPVLVIHGERDAITPVEMGRAVYRAAPEPKKIVTFPEAGHSDHHEFGAFEVVLEWLAQLEPRSAEGNPPVTASPK